MKKPWLDDSNPNVYRVLWTITIIGFIVYLLISGNIGIEDPNTYVSTPITGSPNNPWAPIILSLSSILLVTSVLATWIIKRNLSKEKKQNESYNFKNS